MKALITGINGFVGYYLTQLLLAESIEVYGTILPTEKYEGSCDNIFHMDLTNSKQVDEVISVIKPDYVYHLAGQSSVGLSWQKPAMTIDTNVIGTINLLEALREINCSARILIVGSSDQYGIIRPEDCPIPETKALNPQSPYAVSKMAQELIAMQYYTAYDMDIVLVRAFNHIGPGQRKGFVIADFASQIAEIEKGTKEPIIRVGNLEAKRDFTDVRDIVKAYSLLMKLGVAGEIYNVGSGESHSIEELLLQLLEKSIVDIVIQQDASKMRPSDIRLVECDSRKLKNVTGWTPDFSLKETLEDIIEYWRRFK